MLRWSPWRWPSCSYWRCVRIVHHWSSWHWRLHLLLGCLVLSRCLHWWWAFLDRRRSDRLMRWWGTCSCRWTSCLWWSLRRILRLLLSLPWIEGCHTWSTHSWRWLIPSVGKRSLMWHGWSCWKWWAFLWTAWRSQSLSDCSWSWSQSRS